MFEIDWPFKEFGGNQVTAQHEKDIHTMLARLGPGAQQTADRRYLHMFEKDKQDCYTAPPV